MYTGNGEHSFSLTMCLSIANGIVVDWCDCCYSLWIGHLWPMTMCWIWHSERLGQECPLYCRKDGWRKAQERKDTRNWKMNSFSWKIQWLKQSLGIWESLVHFFPVAEQITICCSCCSTSCSLQHDRRYVWVGEGCVWLFLVTVYFIKK